MTTPVVSILSGTYSRLPYLQRFVESARRSCGTLDYEIVLCDGGSRDGTLEWAREQADIRLIEHGELRGAVAAFNDCFRAARGKYSCPGNDDVEFEGDTIARAVSYLESNPRVGAVAFRNNVPTQNARYRRAPYDFYNGYLYPQTGLLRQFLAQLAGFWGDGYRVYGGDSQIGTRIWEMGWPVVAVDGCSILDHVVDDELRAANHVHRTGSDSTHPDSRLFGQRWKGRLPDRSDWRPAVDRSHLFAKARERTLRTMRFKSTYPNIPARTGLIDEFGKLGPSLQLDQGALVRAHGQAHFQQIALQQIRDFLPDIILFQIQGTDNITLDTLKTVRAEFPNAALVNLNGDIRTPVPAYLIDVAKLVDLSLIASPDLFYEYSLGGATNLGYWLFSYEQPYADTVRKLTSSSPDVAFLANHYQRAGFPDTDLRARAVRALLDAGVQVEVHGKGWDAVIGHNPGSTLEQHEFNVQLYSRSRLALSISHFSELAMYASDRQLLAMATGIPVLTKGFSEMERLGYIDGDTVITWSTPDELVERTRYYLAHRDEAEAIGMRGKQLVTARHSWDVRVRELISMLQVRGPVGGCGSESYIAAHGLRLPAGHVQPAAMAPATTPERNSSMSTTPPVGPGEALLHFVGANHGSTPFYGAVTRRMYKAGLSRPYVAADVRDVPDLLLQSDGGRAVFALVPGSDRPAAESGSYYAAPAELPDESLPYELTLPQRTVAPVAPGLVSTPQPVAPVATNRFTPPDEFDTPEPLDDTAPDGLDNFDADEVANMLASEQAGQQLKQLADGPQPTPLADDDLDDIPGITLDEPVRAPAPKRAAKTTPPKPRGRPRKAK